MKSKPNTDQFKTKKDPSIFLDGGAADAADRTTIVAQSTTTPKQLVGEQKIHREQKVFRLPLDLIKHLKRESYERSINLGSRVTETELVEQALRNFFKI